MSKHLTIDDIDEKIRPHIYTQDYSPQTIIEGVKVIELKTFPSEEGDFGEILRVSDEGFMQGIEGFKIAQINRTRLNPGSIKAWHLHFQQDEIWYLPPAFELLVGLWDLRKESPTNGKTMRIPMGGGRSKLVLIPHGVAHGSANFSLKEIELFYFVNQHFSMQTPDEKRISWDTLGSDFWTPMKD